MDDLKTQLEDTQKRTEILETLAGFCGWEKHTKTLRGVSFPAWYARTGGFRGYCDEFDPCANNQNGAWYLEQILEAITKQGWTLLTHHHDDWVTVDIIFKHDAEPGSSISETATGPLAHRYAVIAAVLEKLKGET